MPVGFVDVLNVLATDMLHHSGDAIGILRRDQEVNVVGHQAIGVKSRAIALHSVSQYLAIVAEVVLSKETAIPIMAALDHMDGSTREKLSVSSVASFKSVWMENEPILWFWPAV